MNKNVLIVSYTFPPTGGAGVQRISKFVKYLPTYGWNPIVLTPSNPSVPLKDESLLQDIPKEIKIYKSKTLEPSIKIKHKLASSKNKNLKSGILSYIKCFLQKIILPDYQVLWWPGLCASLIHALITNKIDCIFATSPPFSALVLPILVGKLFKIPVIIDFRDEWTFVRENFENATRSSLSRRVDKVLEEFVINNCTQFTVASASYIDSIKNRHNFLSMKGVEITNGYDVEDLCTKSSKENCEKVIISYVGTVWKQNSLENFIAACLRLKTINPTLFKNITLRIIGRVVDSEKHYFENAKGKLKIKILNYIEHDEAIKLMLDSDILLLTLSDLPGSERIIPGKTFEYMGSGNHIFAILPNGETKNILKNNYANITFSIPNDINGISENLSEIIVNINKIRLNTPPDVKKYSRSFLTKKLADEFDNVLK